MAARRSGWSSGMPIVAMAMVVLAACNEPDMVADSTTWGRESAAASAKVESGARRDGPTITVYYRHKAGAPSSLAGRVDAAKRSGVVFHSKYHGDLPAAVDVLKDSLRAFMTLPWVDVVEVDSSPPLTIQGAGAAVSAGRIMSQVVPWGVTSIGARTVHSTFGLRGEGVKIAVVDVGAHVGHPDLTPVAGCYDTYSETNTCFLDPHSHGTSVMGVVGARDNTIGVVGVSPAATLYSVRICHWDYFEDKVKCADSRLYDAIGWAMANGIDIINASVGDCGGSISDPLQFMVNTFVAIGGFIVVGAGNGTASGCPSSNLSSMAIASGTIAVAAHNETLSYLTGYPYGSAVTFSAPTNVLTTIPPSDLDVRSGTSHATPHVSGAIALMIQAGFPKNKILQRLKETTHQPGTAPWNQYYGFGQIRLASAIVAKPRVDSVTWCTGTGITVPGSCAITAYTAGGIGTAQVRFEVTRSDSNTTMVYDWGSSSRTITIGSGNYTLSVKAIPREPVYQRVGYYSIQVIPVCTDQQGQGGGGESTNAKEQCGGGGGETEYE